MAIKNKFKFSALIILCMILISRVSFCDEKLNISVTNPWLALLASFIGGPEVNVLSLRIWNGNGDLVIAENGKIIPGRMNSLCRYHQTAVAKAIKRARIVALLPFTDND